MTRSALVIAILLAALTSPTRAQPLGEDLAAERHNAHVRAETRRHMTQADAAGLAQAIKRLRDDTQSKATACLTDLKNLSASQPPASCGAALPMCSEHGGPAKPGTPRWCGPYRKETGPFLDGYGHPFVVTLDADDKAVVHSAGPDGELNTDDDIVRHEF